MAPVTPPPHKHTPIRERVSVICSLVTVHRPALRECCTGTPAQLRLRPPPGLGPRQNHTKNLRGRADCGRRGAPAATLRAASMRSVFHSLLLMSVTCAVLASTGCGAAATQRSTIAPPKPPPSVVTEATYGDAL